MSPPAQPVVLDDAAAPTPLDEWRARAEGTAVERFALRHDRGELPVAARHRQLLPLAAPAAGEQYAFEVDLDACTGCKACVAACHSLNGLDEGEAWRAVGTLVATGDAVVGQAAGSRAVGPGLQHVTAACHHCVDPACLNGCPVDAYEKDPITGIVAHLDDQCIGCRYCELTCPYEVPRFNEDRGIVRKCDLCRGRLAEGEAPACAQACPNSAITVTVVDRAAVVARTAGEALVPGAPPSSLTAPTTRYRSTRPVDGLVAADREVRPAEAHPPLAVMLVITQVAVGAALAALAVELFARPPHASLLTQPIAAVAALAGVGALAASVSHLGRPLLAWRAVIGVRHSWLSREIVAFGAFAPLAVLAAVRPHPLLLGASALAGVAGVACSALVYVATGRQSWRPTVTTARFALTTAAGGAGVLLAVGLVAATGEAAPPALGEGLARGGAPLLGVLSVGKLAVEALELRHGGHRRAGAATAPERHGLDDVRHRSAVLRRRHLRDQTAWRFGLGIAGGAVLPLLAAFAATASAAATFAAAALVLVVAGELIERWQFFTTAAAPRMPGTLP